MLVAPPASTFGCVPDDVLGLADVLLKLTFGLVHFAVGLKVAVARDLSGGILHGARDLFGGAGDPIFVHLWSPGLWTSNE